MALKFIKKNLILIIIIVLIFGGYVFFFNTPRIFKESGENLMNTELNQSVSIGDGYSVSVEEWEFSESENAMMVILSLSSRSGINDKTFTYSAASRLNTGEAKNAPCDVITEIPAFTSVVIRNVPANFQEVALGVLMKDKHESAVKTETGNTEKSKDKQVVLFSNRETVTRVASVKNLDVVGIYIKRLKALIEDTEKQITDIENENKDQKTKQADILELVAELRAQEIYLTDEQLESQRRTVKDLQNNYDSATKQVENNEKKIKQLKEDIRLVNEKITELEDIRKEGTTSP